MQGLRRLFSRSPSTTGNNILSPSSPTHASPSTPLQLAARSRSPANTRASSVQPYAPTANAWGRDFLDKVLELLDERERAIIQGNILSSTDDIESALRDVLEAAQDKQKICDDKRWTFTIRGRTVRLREEADKVVLWLDRIKAVGDVAVNADPIHAGLPWVGIRLLLEVLSNTTTPFRF